MPGRTLPRRLAGIALAMLATAWAAGAAAQPAGATAVFGSAQVQQLGNSVLVTTRNGAGTNRSVIDWRSFSVPAGSYTHFAQPGADSLSINRVTGGKPSDIFGTLSSNGGLVLVNPAGIAVGKGAVVDTAGFTASALALGDADAVAGRLRFEAGRGKGDMDVRGRVLARGGDVVLLGADVRVDQDAIVQAPNGSVILAAGQRIALTGRGLEGIVLEVTAKQDRVVNLGRLEGDAVGLFATQLRHSGVIQASRVVLQGDKVHLERGKGNGKDKDADEAPANDPDLGGSIVAPPSGNAPTGNTGSGSAAPDERQGKDVVQPRQLPPVLVALEAAVPANTVNGAEIAATLQPPTAPDTPRGKRVPPDPDLQCVR